MSNDLKRPQSISKESSPNIETVEHNTSKKNKKKGGGFIEFIDE